MFNVNVLKCVICSGASCGLLRLLAAAYEPNHYREMRMIIELTGYEILDQIKIGQKSHVYRGIRTQDKSPVIIKVLSNEYPTSTEIAKFRQEYETSRYLEIPGVVRAYALEKYHNSLAMILEDFGGVSLAELIKEKTFSLEEYLELSLTLADTLGKIHMKDVIHKDLKPENLIINVASGQVKIADFGIASYLSRENQSANHPGSLEGTLSYISPEQTGRMNRSVDYRSDLYSLGIVLYEIITGQLPFRSDDPMELVHAHIARKAEAPHQLRGEIPLPISRIISKLLEKNAEDRYQNAFGLKADLQNCLEQLKSGGSIDTFEIGQKDLSNRLEIPQKLYGRDEEVKQLLEAFERAGAGQMEMMLVDGYSGIGKSSLVNEVHKPITEKRGYFISGKFDQFKRNVPFAALIDAFKDLVRELLTESEDEIEVWKNKLLTAMGPNGQVIIEVIPEVELITGKQPPIPEMGPAETQNRFNSVFRDFIEVFTHRDHPLAMFLDDLQWADTPTLNLIQMLAEDPDTHFLFFIGAYRDNEVDESHPAVLMIEHVKKSGTSVNKIHLSPLDRENLGQLIGDTVKTSLGKCEDLRDLIMEKTNGNPFFVNQFLKNLAAKELLTFDMTEGSWHWDVARIQEMNITDNVVEMIAGNIQKLNPEAQRIIQLASCVGASFDLKTIATVSEHSILDTAEHLWSAMKEMFIVALGDSYKSLKSAVEKGEDIEKIKVEYRFLHDRVQQAAYSLIEEEQRKQVHQKIGTLLLKDIGEGNLEERLFDVVGQLNYGLDMLETPEQHLELAKLNVQTGEKAKASSAYVPALKYFKVAGELMEKISEPWENHYDIMFPLEREMAETEYLLGNLEPAAAQFDVLLKKAKTIKELANMYAKMTTLKINTNDFHEALELTADMMKVFGIKYKPLPGQIAVLFQVAKTRIRMAFALRGGKKIGHLGELPKMTDEDQLAFLDGTLAGIPAGYLYNPDSMVMSTLKMVDATLKYGVSPYTSFAYAITGIIWTGALGPLLPHFYKEGVEIGEVALKLRLEYGPAAGHSYGKTIFAFCLMQGCWRRPLRGDLIPMTKEAYLACRAVGDNLYGSYLTMFSIYMKILVGYETVSEIYDEHKRFLNFIKQVRDEGLTQVMLLLLSFLQNLKGNTEDRLLLNHEELNEDKYLRIMQESNYTTGLNYYYVVKLHQYYMYAEYEKAMEMAYQADKTKDANLGQVTFGAIAFYSAMAAGALYSDAKGFRKRKYRRIIKRQRKRFKIWSENMPDNWQAKYELILAEEARIQGKDPSKHYETAAATAEKYESVLDHALANELCAKYYDTEKRVNLARMYMTEAEYQYNRWGAKGKISQLNDVYPHLVGGNRNMRKGLSSQSSLSPLSVPGETVIDGGLDGSDDDSISSTTSTGGMLDLATVVKGSQIISGEIKLEKLLEKLLNIIMENAGAEKGFLLMEKQQRLQIEAEKNQAEGEIKVLESEPLEKSQKLSVAIANYVHRIGKSVVLGNAAEEGQFTKDEYILRHKPRSVLCSPIINGGKFVGMVYLENNLSSHAFTQERLELVNLLSTQAAISLENAGLYANLEEKVEERTQELRASKKEIDDIFSNVEQGLLTLTDDLTISSEYSSRVASIFERDDLGGRKFETLFLRDQAFAGKIKEFLEQMLTNSYMSTKLFDRANPLANHHYIMVNNEKKEITKVLDFKFSRIYETDESGKELKKIQKIMVVVDDKTNEFEQKQELEKRAQEQAGKVEKLYQILQLKPEVFSNFISESSETLEQVSKNLRGLGADPGKNRELLQLIFREVHTLKGNARALNLESMGKMAHELEDVFEELKEKPEEITEELKEKTFAAVRILKEDIQDGNALFKKILNMQTALQNKQEDVMEAFAERFRKIVEIESGQMKKTVEFTFKNELEQPLEENLMGKLRNPLSHMIRNSVSHGIESPEERKKLNKPETGIIMLRLTQENDTLTIICEDDGAGLNSQKIRKKAEALKLYSGEALEAMSDNEVNKLIFSSGLSTEDKVTDSSGRGVGMDAVKADLKELNAVIAVNSSLNKHMRFTIQIPL